MAHQVCTPWITPDEMCCEGDVDAVECDGTEVPLVFPYTDEDYALMASNILFARTGFLYPGTCDARIWPCIKGCWNAAYPCWTCCSPATIQLPSGRGFQVHDVIITENGDILPETSYRIERKNWIVRTDGLRWARNSFGLNPNGIETIIEYSYTSAPPVELRAAAAALACELKKACDGGFGCKLPPHVTSIIRQGVAIELADLQVLLNTGMTGIPAIDYALSIHGNPSNDQLLDPAKPPLGWGPAT